MKKHQEIISSRVREALLETVERIEGANGGSYMDAHAWQDSVRDICDAIRAECGLQGNGEA